MDDLRSNKKSKSNNKIYEQIDIDDDINNNNQNQNQSQNDQNMKAKTDDDKNTFIIKSVPNKYAFAINFHLSHRSFFDRKKKLDAMKKKFNFSERKSVTTNDDNNNNYYKDIITTDMTLKSSNSTEQLNDDH
jgi:hypothetical protein